MQLDSQQLNTLADVAGEAARQAGALIRTFTAGEVEVFRKEGGDSLASQVVTEVDERSQAVILEHLESTIVSYDLALLTEELTDDGSRFEKDYFWCIDPLDGTLPFTQGKPGYAVAIALVRRDGVPMIGVVYDPVLDRLYRAVSGQGLRINGQIYQAPLAVKPAGARLKFCMDCTFETDPRREALSAGMEALAQRAGYAGAVIEIHGGAVCNACYVLEHPPAVYLKEPKPELGGGSFWDFAATACIFQEAGASVSDYHGARLELNSAQHTFFNHCGVRFCSGSFTL
ncbi:inositol monophosphatase family protein [Coraliomargarita sp. SDUM461003]|uniref:Inositol monophosphatase family protein n=1 Tax=Thalassobacterium maritimum TaxID=3041265 RepID=A0ABU1AW51_9BACT|nr:inositol monophosphatase family protein [Coraliomargarita sp. SDUM461003]MDQ8208376.1 inositol monophosphatase family protein [Coraliomargarita sp. SDUM461003]